MPMYRRFGSAAIVSLVNGTLLVSTTSASAARATTSSGRVRGYTVN
jgi:hypothetical protein